MILQELPPFQNVGANLTAVLPALPLGMTYQGIVLQRGGTAFTNAHLSNIRLKLEGKQFVDVTGAHLLAQNNKQNLALLNALSQHVHVENTAGAYTQNANTAARTAYAPNYDIIPFADLQARSIGGESMGAIDTSIGYSQFGMEVDVGAATAPTLKAWAILTPPLPAGDPNKQTIRALLKTVHAPGAAGEFSLPLALGSRAGALIHRLFFHHTNVTQLQVTKDGLYLLQTGSVALLNYVQGLRNRSDQSGLIVFDPSFNDNMSESISTVRANGQPANMEFKATVSAADTVTAYSSLFSTIDRL